MKPIQYRIASMNVISTEINSGAFHEGDGKVGVNNSFSFGLDMKQSLLHCKHELTMLQNECVFLKIQLQTTFVIAPESLEAMKYEKVLTIPQGFLVQCASISYGSMRGIVLLKAEQKGLNNVIIPPLYLDETIKEPMTMALDE